MVMACKPSRNALFIWLLQVALGCFIVEAGFIVELFRGKGETSELKSQIKQPLLLEFRSNTLVQPAVGKLEQLSPSKGYLVDEMGQPLVPKLVGKENLEDIFEEVTRKYYNRVPASSKYPMEPTNLMVEIKEIDEEVKKNKFIRIKESHQRLDEILSQRLKEVTEKYREIMNLSNENIGYKKNKASARDKIQEALSYTQQEDMAEAERYKETPNELLKDKDTIQSATKYFLDQGIVRNDDISNTLEALGENFYDEAWFQKNITDRSRREEDFDPFFSSIEIKDYIINHPSIKQHRVILKALNHENLRSSILKFLLSYSELIFYHYSDQMSNSARSSINKILNDLIEGKSLSNHVWESSFTVLISQKLDQI
ncbi:hypothetical protein BY996DRAFT_7069785 [Phakopsora pachyrhizi]|nr:hypothetical protein BY996DRAFT_7069785 [Phakopsora pachyrhizi]